MAELSRKRAGGPFENSRSLRLYQLIGVVAVALLIIAISVHETFSRWNGETPDRSTFDLSFVTVPSKVVPGWVDHGHGMPVSITVKAWDPAYYKKFQNDGVCIIPTSVTPSQKLSLYPMPPTPSGFEATYGGGPLPFITVVNKYLQERHLAQLQQGQMDQIGSIDGTFKNVHFAAVIGDAGFSKLRASDVRLAILDVRCHGSRFKVMWSKIYAPMK